MTLLIENRGAVRILTMNRPEKRNALDTELTQELLEAAARRRRRGRGRRDRAHRRGAGRSAPAPTSPSSRTCRIRRPPKRAPS